MGLTTSFELFNCEHISIQQHNIRFTTVKVQKTILIPWYLIMWNDIPYPSLSIWLDELMGVRQGLTKFMPNLWSVSFAYFDWLMKIPLFLCLIWWSLQKKASYLIVLFQTLSSSNWPILWRYSLIENNGVNVYMSNKQVLFFSFNKKCCVNLAHLKITITRNLLSLLYRPLRSCSNHLKALFKAISKNQRFEKLYFLHITSTGKAFLTSIWK